MPACDAGGGDRNDGAKGGMSEAEDAAGGGPSTAPLLGEDEIRAALGAVRGLESWRCFGRVAACRGQVVRAAGLGGLVGIGDGCVVDADFRTVDVLVILPIERIGERYLQHYAPKQ